MAPGPEKKIHVLPSVARQRRRKTSRILKVALYQRSGNNEGNIEGEEEGHKENPEDHVRPPLSLCSLMHHRGETGGGGRVRDAFSRRSWTETFARGREQQHLEVQRNQAWPLRQSCSCHPGLGSSAKQDARVIMPAAVRAAQTILPKPAAAGPDYRRKPFPGRGGKK